VDARKHKFGRADLPAVFRGGERLVVAKGKKLATFDLAARDVDWEAIAAVALGPSGNLRAPTIRKGKSFYVGFGEEAFAALG
jgi:hypothetical protein